MGDYDGFTKLEKVCAVLAKRLGNKWIRENNRAHIDIAKEILAELYTPKD